MGTKQKRRIARLEREVAHSKRRLNNELDALKLGDPGECSTPIHFNDFMHAIGTLPSGRRPHNEMFELRVPAYADHIRDIETLRPIRAGASIMVCRAVSMRVPIGRESRHLQGWMLPARIVLIDDGCRRHVPA